MKRACASVLLLFIALGPSSGEAKTAKKTSCPKTLTACRPWGCEEKTSEHGIFNTQKNRRPTGEAKIITFAQLQDLQKKAEEVLSALYPNRKMYELTASDRKRLKNLHVPGLTAGEGDLVELTGYIAATPGKPRANKGESVNCHLKKPEDNDFHISLTPGEKQGEHQGIVVEMVPHHRPPEWALNWLKQLQAEQKLVRVRGQLFFDNAHYPNTSPTKEGGQPKRFTVWEVHPVTEFELCDSSTKCQATSSKWVSLEQWVRKQGGD